MTLDQGMIRNPEDPYIDETDGERVVPHGTPWSIISLFLGLMIALTLWILGLV